MNELEYIVVGIPKDDFQSVIIQQDILGYIPVFHINTTSYYYNGGYIVFKKKERKRSKFDLLKKLYERVTKRD